MKTLRLAIESTQQDQEGLVQEIPVSPDEAGKLIDVMEADQLEQATDARLKEADIATEALMSTYEFIKSRGSKIDYASHALAMNGVQAIASLTRVAVPTPRVVGLESFDLNKEQQLNVALESITDTIKNIWEKIKAFFARIYDWIRARIARIGQNIDKLKKLHEELKTKSKDAKFKEEFSVTGYIEKLIGYRKGDPIKNMAVDLKATQVLLDRFVSSQARGDAAPIIDYINNMGFVFDRSRIFETAYKRAVESADAVATAFGASKGTDASNEEAFIVDQIPGNLSLIIRAPELTGDRYVELSKPGSIRITKSQSEEFGEVPKKLDDKFVQASLRFIEITIKVMEQIEDDLKNFPAFKTNIDVTRAKHVEKAANENKDTFHHTSSGVWKAAATLQMYYGVWITQLTGGLMQTSFALTKFCEAGIE